MVWHGLLTTRFQVAGRVSLKLQQIEVTCETKTHDNVFIGMVTSVQYKAIPVCYPARLYLCILSASGPG